MKDDRNRFPKTSKGCACASRLSPRLCATTIVVACPVTLSLRSGHITEVYEMPEPAIHMSEGRSNDIDKDRENVEVSVCCGK